MSDVRLSNASPTLERVDARQPDNVRAPVPRNLFGSPDREEIRRYLTAAIQEDVQHFRAEYNFDPVSERPLTPHSYEWQEDSDAPEFYRRPPHRSERPQRGVDSSGDGRLDAEGGQPNTNGARKRRPGESGDQPWLFTHILVWPRNGIGRGATVVSGVEPQDTVTLQKCAAERLGGGVRSEVLTQLKATWSLVDTDDDNLTRARRFLRDQNLPLLHRNAHVFHPPLPRMSGVFSKCDRTAENRLINFPCVFSPSCQPGSCSDESKSKRSHTDDDDDGAGGQASTATEGGPSRTENCAEIQWKTYQVGNHYLTLLPLLRENATQASKVFWCTHWLSYNQHQQCICNSCRHFLNVIPSNLHARISFSTSVQTMTVHLPAVGGDIKHGRLLSQLHHSPAPFPLLCPTERGDLLLVGNCSLSHHLTDGRENIKAACS